MARVGTSRRKARKRAALIIICVILVALSLVLITGVRAAFYKPAVDVDPGKPVQIEVPEGAGTAVIATQLARAGVVENAAMFRVQSKLAGADGKMRAGVYDLATGMPYDLVIDKLIEGPPIAYVTVTIPEGFTVEQVAARLEKQLGIPAEETLELIKGGADQFVDEHPYLENAYAGSLEGYLFPKTYNIQENASARDAVEMMLDQFDKEFASVDTARASEQGLSMTQVVTLASMIERETRVEKERRLVSSVIYNRLQRGMKLEIDATIEYVLPGNRFRLKNSHLRIDSPYNTYRYEGLPAGPISSPGLASLQAAADPADTDYLYYVLTGKDGTHTFATNKADFLEAKQKSKEVFGK